MPVDASVSCAPGVMIATKMPLERQDPIRRPRSYASILAMLLPNLIWVFLDRGLWVSDTALYGLNSIELYHRLQQNPHGWIQEALAIGPKPPIVPWLGQFFVPLGSLLGNVDAGLLLLPYLCQVAALLFLFETLFEYGRSELVAITGCAAAAAAPLFVDVSKQLYVQPAQLVAVCWFLYIMACSGRWDVARTLLQLSAATSLAMLATMSSPAFCVIPGAVALGRAVWKLRSEEIRLHKRHGYQLLLAGPLVVSAIAWYQRHIVDAITYGNFSFHYTYGGLLGAGYSERLHTWASFLRQFGLTTTVAILLVLATAAMLLGSAEARRGFLLTPLLVGVLQTVVALSILAMSDHQTLRYPLPLLGLVVLVVGVGLINVNKRWLTWVVLGALLAQLGFVNAIAFGYVKRDLWDLRSVQTRPGREMEILEAIVQSTADVEGDVLLVTSCLQIYAFQVEYHAAKQSSGSRDSGPTFSSAEFVLTRPDIAADVESAWQVIAAAQPTAFVVPSDGLREAQRETWSSIRDGWSAIMLGAVAIAERVVAQPNYERRPLPGYPEIEIHRSIEFD